GTCCEPGHSRKDEGDASMVTDASTCCVSVTCRKSTCHRRWASARRCGLVDDLQARRARLGDVEPRAQQVAGPDDVLLRTDPSAHEGPPVRRGAALGVAVEHAGVLVDG